MTKSSPISISVSMHDVLRKQIKASKKQNKTVPTIELSNYIKVGKVVPPAKFRWPELLTRRILTAIPEGADRQSVI
jgi:hypothetical protein